MEQIRHRDLFCMQCLLQFDKKYVFDLHLSLVHDKKVEIKTELNSDFSESQVDADTISKDHERKRSYECEICDYSSSTKGKLKLHVKAVHEKKKLFKCVICDKNFSQKSSLKTHIKSVHEEKKPFNVKFVTKDLL